MTPEQYFTDHGISDASIAEFNLTFDKEKITIPITDSEGKLLYNKYRLLDSTQEKFRFDPGSHPTLFNLKAVIPSKYVVLTEGEIDAIRLNQDGIVAASTTGGANSFKLEWAELLKDKEVYICYDSDPPGVKATIKIVKLFSKIKVISLPEESKDVCEYLIKHTLEEFKTLVKEAREKEEYLAFHTPPEYSVITAEDAFKIDFPEEDWIVDKIIPDSGFVMFSGESGVGKSFISLELIKSVVTKTNFMDHFDVKQSVPILIIDKENGLKRWVKRARGIEVPSSPDIYLLNYPEYFNLQNKEFMESVSDLIEDKGIRIVILDSFIDVMVGNENDSGDTNAVFDALKSISMSVTYVLLHHESKPIPKFARTASQRIRGSTNILAQLSNQFSIEQKNAKILYLEQGKARDGEPIKKCQFEFMNEDGVMKGFKFIGEVADVETKTDEAKAYVMDYLSNSQGVATRKDLLDGASAGIGRNTVDTACRVLETMKILRSYKEGKFKMYELVDQTQLTPAITGIQESYMEEEEIESGGGD